MRVEVSEEPITALEEYATIPIAFEVCSVFDIEGNDQGKFILTERSLDTPYIKDYDAINGENPTEWAKRFDISNWGFFAARVEGRLVGGAVVAFNSPGIIMLEGRRDLAVLWDIRVSPEAREQGIGSALFQAVEDWARARGCRHLKIETQNINVPACRFYARQGCKLSVVDRFAYPELPDEIQLLWFKEIPLASDSFPWHPFPQLETERLVLREITHADSAALFEIYSDEEVMRYWSCKPFSSIDQANSLIAKIKQSLESGNSIDWAITLRGSDQLIGKCRFSTWKREHCRAEISYILSRKYWGQGIAREALHSILTFGFIHMGLHSIEAQVTPGNTASTHMLEKLGFVLEGHLRESFLVEDTFVDSLIYSLLRKDWTG